jgi:hypothetical protein
MVLLLCDISVPTSHVYIIVCVTIIIHVAMNVVKCVRAIDIGAVSVQQPLQPPPDPVKMPRGE